MKIRRSARTGAILLAVLGTAATFVPPASAEGVKDLAFQGTANVTTGLGAPVVTGTPSLTAKPQPDKKNPPFNVTGGNTRSGTFTSAAGGCAGVSAMPKPEKPTPAGQGPFTCSIGATFTVDGFCGLSDGRGTGTLTVTSTLGFTQLIGFKFTWFDPGNGTLAVLGNWWFGGGPEPAPPFIDGDLVAAVRATPATSGVPPTQSCLGKSQRDFLVQGEATLTHPKCLPSHQTGTPCDLP
jgi:hypothetical protein